MDELYKPIKSVLRSGLTIITVRTHEPDLIGGEFRIGSGTAHVAAWDTRWEGISHATEHMCGLGASRKYAPDEANAIAKSEFFYSPNAWTDLTDTRYFTGGTQTGRVLSEHQFWGALELTLDGVLFPKFDQHTWGREQDRIIREIAKNLNQGSLDQKACDKAMFGAAYLGLSILGKKDQVASYTLEDFFTSHYRVYSLSNSTITLVGNISHAEATVKLEAMLKDAPKHSTPMPILQSTNFQRGEFQWKLPLENPDNLNIYLKFPAVDASSPDTFATDIAAVSLSRIIEEKLKDKYHLYAADVAYLGYNSNQSNISLWLGTEAGSQAAAPLAYALELMQDPKTFKLIEERHEQGVARMAEFVRREEPTTGELAKTLNDLNAIGAPLLSPRERIRQYQRTTPEQVAEILARVNSAPAFLSLKGHSDALMGAPTIDDIDRYRTQSKPVSILRPSRPVAPPSVWPIIGEPNSPLSAIV